jgi:hypothetical protein
MFGLRGGMVSCPLDACGVGSGSGGDFLEIIIAIVISRTYNHALVSRPRPQAEFIWERSVECTTVCVAKFRIQESPMSFVQTFTSIALVAVVCLFGLVAHSAAGDVADAKMIVGKWSRVTVFERKGKKETLRHNLEYRRDGTYFYGAGFNGSSGVWKIKGGKLIQKITEGLFVPKGGGPWVDSRYRVTNDELELQQLGPQADSKKELWKREK